LLPLFNIDGSTAENILAVFLMLNYIYLMNKKFFLKNTNCISTVKNYREVVK